MSPIEDEIRDTLRAEAACLHEMRPLRLPVSVAPHEPQGAPRTRRARRLRTWVGPAVAATVVLLIAVIQVTFRPIWDAHTAAPAASPSPVAGPALAADAVPRYYVYFGSGGRSAGPAIVVGDETTRRTIATVPVLPRGNYGNYAMSDVTVAGAADDRTFIVSASVSTHSSADAAAWVTSPLTWYLVRIEPGAADPVRVTKLPVQFPANLRKPGHPDGLAVVTTGLSGDGTELAVVESEVTPSWASGLPLTLQVYSVTTGRLQHSWPVGIDDTQANLKPVSDLSWVGDSTLGFAVTYTPAVREEVRTLDVSASGGTLLADSRVVWSQDVPATPLTPQEKATISTIEPPPHACDTPFLTRDGRAVVCGTSTYSASTKHLTAVWLAYPLATPTRPRVLGRVEEPRSVSDFNGTISVEWANPSGTEVIGVWNPESITGPSNNPVSSVTNYEGYIGHGTVTSFPYILGGGPDITW